MRSSRRRAMPTCRAHNMPHTRSGRRCRSAGYDAKPRKEESRNEPNPIFEHPEHARAKFTKRKPNFGPHPNEMKPLALLRNEPNSSLPAPVPRAHSPPLSNTWEAPERDLRNEPNFSPIPNKMKPLAPLRNEPNSRLPAPRTSRSQPAPLSNTREARERDLRNEPNFDPNPNKMKPLTHFAKRTQFSPPAPGPRFPPPVLN